ncbi:MAG: hypothetical protein QM817_38075 [Archangium sp.]
MSVSVVMAMWLAVAPSQCVPPNVVTLGWKEGATVESVAEWLQKNLCVKVTIEPSAKGAKFGIGVSGKTDVADVQALVDAAAVASGLVMSVDATGWTFSLPSPEERPCREAAAAIRVSSDGQRSVSRKVFERSDWQTCTVNAARVVPSMDGGELDGLRLFSIRAQSVWAAAGFLNGDVLRSVNGLPLLEPDHVLVAREKLKNTEKLDFLVKRRDALVHVVIRIEP